MAHYRGKVDPETDTNKNFKMKVELGCGHIRDVRKQFLSLQDKEYYCLQCDDFVIAAKMADRWEG